MPLSGLVTIPLNPGMNNTSDVALRVVLDSNVLLSALVFKGGVLGCFRALWTVGKIHPYGSKQTIQELIGQLANPKFKLNSIEQDALLADYLPFVQVADRSENDNQANIPICRDPKDQMFLVLAHASKADCLITGDQDLLILAGTPNLPFRILKSVEFLTQYQLMP
jgi:uncharacterized protein